MNFKKTASRLIAIVVVTVICFTLASFSISALNLDLKGSISLHVSDSETNIPIEGVTFRLYLFAAAYKNDDGVGYHYVVPYNDCDMDMGNLQDAYLPVHLSHFALTHDLPYTEKTSDPTGGIRFDNLAPGVYLIFATDIIKNYFLPAPFVINIPVFDEKNQNWDYDVNATPKMQLTGSNLAGETTYLSVKKLWSTDEQIPEKVTVSLLRDLREVEKIELSAENNWYYRWDKLDKRHTWNVVESVVPDGYKVSYDTSANTVIITNKKDGYRPEETTLPEESTGPSDTTKPTVPPESTTKPDELIDTGQLNWPVPVFSIAGLLLFSAGWAMLNLGRKEDEEAT